MITSRSALRKNLHYRCILSSRWQSTQNQLDTVEPVEYPPIEDLSPAAVFRKQRRKYAERIKNELPTVEQKIHVLNLPKYYGWPAFSIKEYHLPYNYLPFVQFITRTVVNEDKHLPLYKTNENIQKLKNQLKSELEKFLLFENSVRYRHEVEPIYANEENMPFYTPGQQKDFRLRPFVKQFNNVITRTLAPEYKHLYSAQFDLDPRLEAFWRVGGFYPNEADIKLRTDKEIHESLRKDPIDRFMQYFGNPILQIRSELPLPPLPKIDIEAKMGKPSEKSEEEILSLTSNEVCEPNIFEKTVEPVPEIDNSTNFFYPPQEYRYMPDWYLGVKRERQMGTIIPGFWPNDPHRFGIVSYHSTNHLLDRPEHYGPEDPVETLHAQAVLASYAWTYVLACYQGFTTYNDLTYPFTNQTILTDGKMFSFYQYQLNTILLNADNNEPCNPVYNECHGTAPMELYHKVGIDRVEGWNDEALLNLLAIYVNIPNDRDGINLCPYLKPDMKYISQIPDADERNWWYKKFHFITSRRPRHELPPEIFDWERIYKIETNYRKIDARKRFFEKFEDPINDRKLNQHLADYIIKSERVHKNVRWRPMYYIEVFPEYHEIV